MLRVPAIRAFRSVLLCYSLNLLFVEFLIRSAFFAEGEFILAGATVFTGRRLLLFRSFSAPSFQMSLIVIRIESFRLGAVHSPNRIAIVLTLIATFLALCPWSGRR